MDETRNLANTAATETRVDVVRAALELLEAGEPAATAALCHPEFELRWTSSGRLPRTYRGPAALAQHHRDLARGRDSLHVTCERVTSAGDRVIAYYAVDVVGPGDTVAETRHSALVRVRDGRLRRWEALEDTTRL
jgi:ketosteroid isomerase-like protein